MITLNANLKMTLDTIEEIKSQLEITAQDLETLIILQASLADMLLEQVNSQVKVA